MAKATNIEEVLVNRDPSPKIWTQADITGGMIQNTSRELSYQNKGNESSEVKLIKIVAPPRLQITISKTVQNAKQEVVPQFYVGDMGGLIDFRRASNKNLTIGRGEYIYLDLIHAYTDNISFFIFCDKDQLLWVDQPVKRAPPRRPPINTAKILKQQAQTQRQMGEILGLLAGR